MYKLIINTKKLNPKRVPRITFYNRIKQQKTNEVKIFF